MIASRVLRAGILAYIFCAGNVVLAKECGGVNHRPHEKGEYKFKISSWVRMGDNGHYYRTCVENISDRDLWFDWFTPGPTTYVPPHESATSTRYFIDRKSVDHLGCVQYGNYRAPMDEYFIGHENDRQQIAKERNTGCKVSRGPGMYQTAAGTPDRVNIAFDTSLFVPSNSKNVRDTLIRLDLSIKLQQKTSATAWSAMRYLAKPHENSKGDPTRLTMRTNSEVLEAAMTKGGFKEGYAKLQREGVLAFEIPLPKKFTIGNARYQFYDENNVLVGAIFVPVPEAKTE